MGKLCPSLRNALYPLHLIKAQSPSSQPPPPLRPNAPVRYKLHNPKSGACGKLKSKRSQEAAVFVEQAVFKSPSLLAAKKVFDSILSSTSSSNLTLPFSAYNSLLNSFSSVASDQRDVLAFFRYMLQKSPSFNPDHSTFHILLTHARSISAVNQIFELMSHSEVPPLASTVDIAVRSLCSAELTEEASELLKNMAERNCAPDMFTYNFLIRRLCKSRSLSTVYQLVEDLENTATLKPDLVTYTILIDAACSSRNLREAMRLVEELGHRGFKPDQFVYNTIMKGYCIMDRGNETVGVYKKMMVAGIEPDLVTYNTLIFGLSKCGRVDEARKYFNLMADTGHFPDTTTYTSLMNGMCRKGKALDAVLLLKKMEERGCSPNECTYNTLLLGLCKNKNLERGMELYEAMKSNEMRLDGGSYSTLVRALCRNDRVAEAYEVFDYARESKSVTDVVAYTSLESSLKWVQKNEQK